MNAKHPEAFEEVLHKDNQNKATVLGKNLDSMEGEGDAVRNEDNTYRNEEETEMDIHSTNESGDEGAIKDEKDLIDSQNRHPKSPDNLLEDDEEAVSNESEIKESHDVRNDNITYDNDKQEFTRTSVKRSSVHDHFDKVNVQHPKTKKTRGGVICKYCRRQFAHRISSISSLIYSTNSLRPFMKFIKRTKKYVLSLLTTKKEMEQMSMNQMRITIILGWIISAPID